MSTCSRSARRAAGLLALVLPLGGVALAAPAAASTTAKEVVYSVNDDAGSSIQLRNLASRATTTVLATTDTTDYTSPELSPTGDRVVAAYDAFSATATTSGVEVVGRDGSAVRRLTASVQGADDTTSVFDVEPTFSPDGTTVLFTQVSLTDNGNNAPTLTFGLYTVSASATAPGTEQQLAGTPQGFGGSYSPDGDKVVYTRITDNQTGDGDLRVLDIAGGTSTTLTARGLYPKYSPDGTTIAFSQQVVAASDSADEVDQIATVPAAGGTSTLLPATRSGSGSVATHPAWLPDGESLVYDRYALDSTGNPGSTDLYAVDPAGVRSGKLVSSTNTDTQEGFVQGPAPLDVVSGTPSTFVPVTPKRILDTKAGTGAPLAKVGPGGTVRLQVTGTSTQEGVVPAGATAVVLNLTLLNGTSATDVRVYPSGAAVPPTSTLNATAANQIVPNQVTSALGDDGAVVVRNNGGSVNLLADVQGYYVPATSAASGSGFTAVDPARILNTRTGTGTDKANIGPAGTRDLKVTGTLPRDGGGSVTVPATATAVVLNVTAVGGQSLTDVRVYPTPADGSVPVVSDLNVAKGQAAANLVTVLVGSGGTVRFRNAAGSIVLFADIAGYYDPSTGGRFVPVTPARFLDTRDGTGAAPISTTAGDYLDLKTAGTRGVPTTALASVLNITGTGPTAATDVRAYPSTAGAVPPVSNLNLVKGATRANAAVVKNGSNGRVRLRNGAGSVALIGDLAGYFVPAS